MGDNFSRLKILILSSEFVILYLPVDYQGGRLPHPVRLSVKDGRIPNVEVIFNGWEENRTCLFRYGLVVDYRLYVTITKEIITIGGSQPSIRFANVFSSIGPNLPTIGITETELIWYHITTPNHWARPHVQYHGV